MAVQVFCDDTTTTLNGSINSSVTSIIVNTTTGFPTTGNFDIRIDDEYMTVTSLSGTIWTVIRGIAGSTAATHANAATVYPVVTKEGFDQRFKDNIGRGAASGLPSNERSGKLYFSSDEPGMYFDDGTNWNFHGPFNFPCTSPILANFPTWFNQGTASANQQKYGVCLNIPSSASGTSISGVVQNIPSTPFSITTLFTMPILKDNFLSGILLLNSSNNHCYTFAIGAGSSGSTFSPSTGNNPVAVIYYFSSATSWISTIKGPFGINQPCFLKYQDTGSNRNFFLSADGINFTQFYTEVSGANTTFDKIGICGSADNEGHQPSVGMSIPFYHWKQGT